MLRGFWISASRNGGSILILCNTLLIKCIFRHSSVSRRQWKPKQHAACLQWYDVDSSTAQEAASALTLWWHWQNMTTSSDDCVLYSTLFEAYRLDHCDVPGTTTVTSRYKTDRWFALQIYVKSVNLIICVVIFRHNIWTYIVKYSTTTYLMFLFTRLVIYSVRPGQCYFYQNIIFFVPLVYHWFFNVSLCLFKYRQYNIHPINAQYDPSSHLLIRKWMCVCVIGSKNLFF